LRSGNVVRVELPLPLPCEYRIHWRDAATHDDVREYRELLRPLILQDLAALDGRAHCMRDDLDQNFQTEEK